MGGGVKNLRGRRYEASGDPLKRWNTNSPGLPCVRRKVILHSKWSGELGGKCRVGSECAYWRGISE